MMFTDEIIKQCPYCGLEGSVKQFGTWEKNGKRGLLGKTPEGYIMLLCPKCENHIKYDTLSNEFLRQESDKNRHVPLIVGVISVAAAFFIVFYFSGWWKYLVGSILLAFGWVSLKTGLFATNKEIEELTTSIPLSEETKRKFDNRL
jgi:hypothetical protein